MRYVFHPKALNEYAEAVQYYRAPRKIDVPIAKTLEISWLILNSAASFSTILRTELSRYDAIGTEAFKVGMGFNQGCVQV
jgi:hypothetical protein